MLESNVLIITIVDWWFSSFQIGLQSYDYRFEIALLSNDKYCTYLTCDGEVTVSEEFPTEVAARGVATSMLASVRYELGG